MAENFLNHLTSVYLRECTNDLFIYVVMNDVISHLGMMHAVPNTTIVHFLKSVTYFSDGNEVVARQQ